MGMQYLDVLLKLNLSIIITIIITITNSLLHSINRELYMMIGIEASNGLIDLADDVS